MISCSTSRGNINSPISNFDCLKHDVPFLPRNNLNNVIKDININLVDLPEIDIQKNAIINRVILNKLPNETEYIEFKHIKIFGYDNELQNVETVEYSYENFPTIKSHYFGLFAPIKQKISMKNYKVLNGKINIDEFLNFELKELKKSVSEVTTINKISVVINCIKKDGSEEDKEVIFNIEEKKNIELNQEHYVKYYFTNERIPNGSIAFVMDTSEAYKFDEEYDIWRKI